MSLLKSFFQANPVPEIAPAFAALVIAITIGASIGCANMKTKGPDWIDMKIRRVKIVHAERKEFLKPMGGTELQTVLTILVEEISQKNERDGVIHSIKVCGSPTVTYTAGSDTPDSILQQGTHLGCPLVDIRLHQGESAF